MAQENLFSDPKWAGIDAARCHADPGWYAEALATVRQIAEESPHLASDDVWAAGLQPTREPRALGPVFLEAERQGWITPTNRHRLSRKRSCHKRPVRIWRSNLTTTTKGAE